MRLLRALAGTLLWIVAAVLGLVGSILCVTILLIPVGLAVLVYSRRLFAFSLKLMAPRSTARAEQGSAAARKAFGRRARA